MLKIRTGLLLAGQVEQAVALYSSVFPNARVVGMSYYPEGAPRPAGETLTAELEIAGQALVLINGGADLPSSPLTSLIVFCDTQAEIDRCWEGLGKGGAPGSEGWLTDRFGVTWQIVPTVLDSLLGDDPDAAERVLQAMLSMEKMDIAALERAYRGE